MFRVFKQMNVRNRAYVIDSKGNKVFYGTIHQCSKFIEYMLSEGGEEHEQSDYITGRTNRVRMDEK